MSHDFTDEELMAFADGEAPAGKAKLIAAAAAKDPAVAKRIDMFRSTTKALKASFPPVANVTRDNDLAAMIRGKAHGNGPDQTPDNVVQFPRRKPVAKPWWQQAASAAAVLMVVLVASYLLTTPGPQPKATGQAGLIALAPDTLKALQTQKSGTDLQTGQGNLTMIASFKNAQGILCREFEVKTADKLKWTNIACRTGTEWTVVAAVSAPAAEDVFVPAGSAEAIEAYLQSSGMTEALTAEAESAALSVP